MYDIIRYVFTILRVREEEEKKGRPPLLPRFIYPPRRWAFAMPSIIVPPPPEPAGARNPRVQWRFVVRCRIQHTHVSLYVPSAASIIFADILNKMRANPPYTNDTFWPYRAPLCYLYLPSYSPTLRKITPSISGDSPPPRKTY